MNEMKRFSKMVALLLTVTMMFSLAACTQARSAVLTYEGNTLSTAQYAFALAGRKGEIEDQYSSYYGSDISSNAEFWAQTVENGTLADAVESGILDYCKLMLVVNKLCKDYNIEITDETTLADIDTMMETITTDFGGEDALAIALAEYGITKEELKEYYKTYERINLLKDYWYGDNGSMKIPESEVNEKFLKDYFKIDFMSFSYNTTNTEDETVAYYFDEITDAEARTYFDTNYVKVQHILYMTVDTSGNALSDEKVALAEQNATESFNSIVAGTTTFDDESVDNEDSGKEYVFTYEAMADEFEAASFEMAVGDVRLVKTKYGYHIIKKFATNDADFTSKLEAVKNTMSYARTKANAEEMLAKVNAGTAEFADGGDDADYKFYADNIFTSGDIGDDDLEEQITSMAVGEYKLVDMGSSYGYYLFHRTEITLDDIADYYDTIEGDLISTAFYAYIEAYFPSITTVDEEIAKFDITTITSFPVYSTED